MSEQIEQVHYNKPQLLSLMIMAHEETAIWGRGTGKNDGLIAPRTSHNIHTLVRGKGVYVGATYQQLLSRTLPATMAGLERLGYKRDKHFFIGKKPPKSWKWPEPYVPTFSSDYFIYWYNGSGIHLVSQDRPGTSNGLSIDWIIGDEAKLLNKQKLDSELLPANRGNMQYFGGMPEHHSILFASDMPTNASGKWLLEKSEQMNIEQIDLILNLSIEINLLQTELRTANLSRKKKLIPQLNKYITYYNELRIGSVYYSEFSTLENIEALGIEYIKQMKRVLPDIVFQASILGKRIIRSEHGFYPLFEEDVHTYDAFDYSYIDSLDYNFNKLQSQDCRMDADIIRSQPLEISMDYGASINCMVVAQESSKEFKYVNAFHVLHPNRMKDVVTMFIDYYKQYPTKVVYYWYDHTAVGTDADRLQPLYEIVADMLRSAGWTVQLRYIGQAPGHRNKYTLWSYALKGDHPRIPAVRFNKSNCPNLITSIQQAEVYEGRTGFEKDKRDEKNKALAQEHTTHFSDAADTLLWGKYSTKFDVEYDFIDNIIS